MGRGVRHTGGKIFGEGGTQEEIIREGYTHIRGKEARIKKNIGERMHAGGQCCRGKHAYLGKGGTQEEKNLGWRHESFNSGREQHLRKIYGGARHAA